MFTMRPCPRLRSALTPGKFCGMAKRKTKPKREKLPHGRPSLWSEEVATAILDHVSSGKTLTSYCSQVGNPALTTVYAWAREMPEFSARLRAARIAQADSLFEEIQDIADARLQYGKRGEAVRGTGLMQRAQQIDVRKFRVARLNRALYGDKQDVNVGGHLDAPLAVAAKVDVGVLSPEEQEQLRALSRKMLQGKSE